MKEKRKLDNKKKWIIIFTSIFGVISIICGIFYFLILDIKPFPYADQNLTNNQVINKEITRSLSKAESDQNIDFKINQDSLNQLLINSRKEAGNDSNFGNFFVDIKNDNYCFYADTDLKAVRSKVIIDTTLTTNEDSFVFNINKVKLGKLRANYMLSKTPIVETFKNAGLNIQLIDNQIVYSKEDVKSDLTNMLLSKNNELFNVVLDNINLENYDNPFNINGSLTSLIENKDISDCSIDGPHYSNYDSTKTAISSATQNIKNVLSQNETVIKETADSQFANLKTLNPKGESVNSIAKKQIQTLPTDPSSYVGNTKVASVSETQLNEVLQTSDILGKNSIFYYNNELSFIVVDRLYSDIFMNESNEKYINYTLGININGLETRVVIETKYSPVVNEFASDFNITNIYYGTNVVNNTSKKIIKGIFKTIIQSIDDSWFTYNQEGNKVIFDFSKLIKNDSDLATYKDLFYEGGGTRDLIVSDSKLNETGEFALFYQL